MKALSLFVCLVFCALYMGLTPVAAQSTARKQASMTNYVNTSFKGAIKPVSSKSLQPQSYKSFAGWLNRASISEKRKKAVRSLLAKFPKGRQEIKFLKVAGVTYQKTGKKGDLFIIILPYKVQKVNGVRLDIIRLIENQLASEDEDDEDFEFESGESCFCANSNNCDCVSCTGDCGGCGGCGSSGGEEDELLEKVVWW